MLGDSNNITLLLGGIRSGKSDYAETMAVRSGLSVICLTTDKNLDEEMKERINHYQNSHSTQWKYIETPLHLGEAISTYSKPDCCLIVDCLMLWLKNLILEDNRYLNENSQNIKLGKTFESEMKQLFDALPDVQGKLIFISNEVGMGPIPHTAFLEVLANELGQLNQKIAKVCSHVYMMAAGIPITVKNC